MINFPDSPTLNQSFTSAGATWTWDGTKWVAASGSAAYHDIGRNFIHNSLFNIAQRGPGPFVITGVSLYTADRWSGTTGGDTAQVALSAANDADRASIGDETARSVLNVSFTGLAGTNNYVLIIQKIERIARLAGKTVMVSFWANSSVASAKLGVSLDQIFGTGGSPSAAIVGTGQAVTLSATAAAWTRQSVTFSVPSSAGKTFGTNGDDYSSLNFWYSSGSAQATRAGNIGAQSGIINLWGVQLEIGSTATPLEKRDPQQDLARCQRFAELVTGSIGGYNTAAGVVQANSYFAVTKRAAPTLGFVTPGASLTNASGLTADQANVNSFRVWTQATATGTASAAFFNCLASADL